MSRRLGVLISGRGSNLQSIIDAVADGRLNATIALVLSNRPEAAGLQRARQAGIEALTLAPRDYADRDTYDRAVAHALEARRVDVVCLAGFMRLVGTPLLDLHLSLRCSRRVNHDHTIDFDGHNYEIAPTLRKTVTLVHHPSRQFWILEHSPIDVWPTILGHFTL